MQKDKYSYSEHKVYDKTASKENLANVKKSAGSAWGKVKEATKKAANAVKHNEDSTTKGKLASAAGAVKDIVVASGPATAEVASKSASELVDLAKKDDVVIDSTKVGTIVYIVKAKVRAGFDLSKIEEGDLIAKGDTLSIKLPGIEIFDVIVNPSDWEIFDRVGEWSDDDIRMLQTTAKVDIKNDAIAYGLLEKAESFGKESLISLFKTFGFSEVVIK